MLVLTIMFYSSRILANAIWLHPAMRLEKCWMLLKKKILYENEKFKCLPLLAVLLYSWEFPTVNADKKEKKTDSTVIHFYIVVSHKANIPTWLSCLLWIPGGLIKSIVNVTRW